MTQFFSPCSRQCRNYFIYLFNLDFFLQIAWRNVWVKFTPNKLHRNCFLNWTKFIVFSHFTLQTAFLKHFFLSKYDKKARLNKNRIYPSKWLKHEYWCEIIKKWKNWISKCATNFAYMLSMSNVIEIIQFIQNLKDNFSLHKHVYCVHNSISEYLLFIKNCLSSKEASAV